MTLRFLFVTALLLVLTTLLAYVLTFRQASLSAEPAHWGQFGDYVGGLLNPTLSLLALIGLLITIRQNHHDLHLTQRALHETSTTSRRQAQYFDVEAKKADILRVIRELNSELRDLSKQSLEVQIETSAPEATAPAHSTTESIQLGVLLDSTDSRLHTTFIFPASVGGPFRRWYHLTAGRMTELKTYLAQYEALAGDDIVSTFYRIRLVLAARTLAKYEYLASDVLAFYDSFETTVRQGMR